MIHVFIGYDPREAIAYHVCANSMIRHSSEVLAITPLALANLKTYSETHTDGSNQFIYTRFLLPHLMGYAGWALFVDGDMLVRDDLAKLWALRDETKAVMCVHHDYKTKAGTKYLGAVNADYPRKNWSSVVLWNCGHPTSSDPIRRPACCTGRSARPASTNMPTRRWQPNGTARSCSPISACSG